MRATELNDTEFLPYFQPYINQLGDLVLVDGLEDGLEKTINFFQSIPEEKHEYRYAEGKWTVKEVLCHLIDSERVFAYRALRFARNDKTTVSGFDENDYADESHANSRTLDNLLKEYALVRKSSILLYKSFNENVLKRSGIAGSGEVSVRALGFLISGHEKHHIEVVKERYL